MKWLRGMALTAGVLLSHTADDIGRVAQEVGGALCSLHMNGGRIRIVLKHNSAVSVVGVGKEERTPIGLYVYLNRKL